MAITEVLSLTPRNSCSAMTNPFNSFSALIQSLEIVLQKKESNLFSVLRYFCLFSLGMPNTKFGHRIARDDEEMFAHTQHRAPALLVSQYETEHCGSKSPTKQESGIYVLSLDKLNRQLGAILLTTNFFQYHFPLFLLKTDIIVNSVSEQKVDLIRITRKINTRKCKCTPVQTSLMNIP